VYAVAFGPDGRLLVTGSGSLHSVSVGGGNYVYYSDGVVALWNLADRSHPERVDTFTLGRSVKDGKVHAVAFSPDERLIATTGDPGTAVLWDVSDASRLTRAATLGVAKWYESIVYAPAFCPGVGCWPPAVTTRPWSCGRSATRGTRPGSPLFAPVTDA
jgi:WD40 repeat protein